MMERASSAEIGLTAGDVLSSVRRLVSGELPGALSAPRQLPGPLRSDVLRQSPVEAAPAVSAGGPVGPARCGPLLLTPALRVYPAAPPPPAGVQAAGVVEAASRADAPLSALVAQMAAGVEGDWDAELAVPPGDDAALVWEPAVLEPRPGGEGIRLRPADEARLHAAWRDGALAEPSRTAAPPPAPAAQARQRVFAPGDGDDFDEDALREVIRDIIREELAGVMGERITRNIRKLVRAEVHRALDIEALSLRRD